MPPVLLDAERQVWLVLGRFRLVGYLHEASLALLAARLLSLRVVNWRRVAAVLVRLVNLVHELLRGAARAERSHLLLFL